MTADDNPYRTPETTSVAPETNDGALRRLLRIAVLGIAGFATFSTIGAVVIWARDAELPAWAVGILGVVIFAASDVLYVGPRAGDTVLRRVGVTIGVFVVTLIASGVIANVLGWDLNVYRGNPRRVPPHGNHMLVTQCAVFILLQFAARRWWGQSRAAQGTNADSADAR